MKQLQSTQTITPERKVSAAYIVLCQSAGNPDFGENPKLPISVPAEIPCDTLRECLQACMLYISRWNLGGGNWTGGQIFHPDKGIVATVSANGKIWKWDLKQIPITYFRANSKVIYDCREQIKTGLDDKIE